MLFKLVLQPTRREGLKQEGTDALEDGKQDLALEKFSEAIGVPT